MPILHFHFTVETPEGTYSTDGQTVVLCPLGTYQDMTAQTSCKPCPSGTTTPGVGAEHVTECTGERLLHTHAQYILLCFLCCFIKTVLSSGYILILLSIEYIVGPQFQTFTDIENVECSLSNY